MNIFLISFLFALILSVILSPLTRRIGIYFNAIDVPLVNKIHTKATPRLGGLAIFSSFILALVLSHFFVAEESELLVLDKKTSFTLFGCLIVFGIGLFDDFHRLGPKIKFLFQVAGATIAFWGGCRIYGLTLWGHFAYLDFLSYFLTVAWFVLFINAVNLIDGLDGLAGGVAFLTCLVMIIVNIVGQNFIIALYFAALGGATLGFLRYNFSPASIFMGDGGSYFLGYAIAAFSILGSSKTQISAIFLIPLISLGVPLFDTLLSPIRRFILGRKMFSPDTGHIHHYLLRLGFSSQNAVLIIYGITIALCLISILIVNIRNKAAGLFFIILSAALFILMRKSDFPKYLGLDKISVWLRDIRNSASISYSRRVFWGIQADTDQAKNIRDLWKHVTRALNVLEIDLAQLDINNSILPSNLSPLPPLTWKQKDFMDDQAMNKEGFLKMELPLIDEKGSFIGTFSITKNLHHEPLSSLTLQQLEHLRQSIISALFRIQSSENHPL